MLEDGFNFLPAEHQPPPVGAVEPSLPYQPVTTEPKPVKKPVKKARRRVLQLPASTRQKNRAAQQRFRERSKVSSCCIHCK